MKFVLLFFVGLSSFSACKSQSPSATRVETLTPKAFLEAYEKAEAPQLIDCRTPDEVAGGGLDEAQNIDFSSLAFRQNLTQLDLKRPVFIYCQKGGRSAAAAQILDSMGFVRVIDMEGGYAEFQKQR